MTWFINKNEDKNSLWESLLPIIVPASTIFTNPNNLFIDLEEVKRCDLIICLFSDLDETLKNVLEESVEQRVPLLCIIDHLNRADYEFLTSRNVKGIISVSASLDSLQTALGIVKNGGSYIESPFTSTSF